MLIDLLSIDFPIVEYENLTVGGHVDVEFAAPESCFWAHFNAATEFGV